MNLELLDPFRRQIPDRVDSTLNLPLALHKARQKSEEADAEWKAAFHLAFNRRGTYLAVGHATGTVAVHDFLSRTLSAIYPHQTKEEDENEEQMKYPNGVTSVSWARRSRSLLVGAVGDRHVRLLDTTHPFGPEECCFVAPTNTHDKGDHDDGDHDEKPRGRTSLSHSTTDKPLIAAFKNPQSDATYAKTIRKVSTKKIKTTTDEIPDAPSQDEGSEGITERFPIVLFELPETIGGSLQIHPKDNTTGLAVLSTGELVVFRTPNNIWSKEVVEREDGAESVCKVVSLWGGEDDHVTTASFSNVGDRVYLATKSGYLIGLEIGHLLYCMTTTADSIPEAEPIFRTSIGCTAWHLLLSRNGKHILLNCSDGALRLYVTNDCVEDKADIKPKVFQDIVSKEPFVCCDFSGDGEFMVGGCNGARDDKYQLFLWNAATGALMDQLTGPLVSLYSVAWHPTRSFIAVATSDGLVDVWGPRMDWTAFAPDFQALPMNCEYVEQEDEFDVTDDAVKKRCSQGEETLNEVDVTTIEPVPVFASDSESETEVFTFEAKMNNLMFGRGRNRADGKVGTDDKD